MKNKHLLILSFLLIVSSLCATAQKVNPADIAGLRSDSVPKQIVDYSSLRIHYNYLYSRDAENPNLRRRDETVLQIGERTTRFSDYNSLRGDSLNDRSFKDGIHFTQYMGAFMGIKGKANFKENIVTGYPEGKITVQQSVVLTENYEYVEDVPEIEWTLCEGGADVKGYSCKKATCSFRGRDYVAWYAEDIDLPYGPYKFGGLPGLILFITDTQKQFEFSLNGIERLAEPEPIYFTDRKRINSTREKVAKIKKNYCANPAKGLVEIGNITLSEEVAASVKPLPYNPIELE